MKRSLIFFFFILLTYALSAQQNPSFVGLKAGASFPVGKFHSIDLADEGGFARAGFATSIEGAWIFKPWLGIGGYSSLHLHPVDVTSLATEKMAENQFMTGLSVLSDPYLSVSFYAGLYFQVPLAGRLSATAKALGGVIYSRTPYQLYKADYFLIGKDWYDVTSSGDYDGSFLAGAGLRYDLKNCIGFTLGTEFTYNVMDFDFFTSDGSIRTDKRVVSFVDLVAGIVIKI